MEMSVMILSINSSNIGQKSSLCYGTLQDIVWLITLWKFRLILEYLEYNTGFVKMLKRKNKPNKKTFSEEITSYVISLWDG